MSLSSTLLSSSSTRIASSMELAYFAPLGFGRFRCPPVVSGGVVGAADENTSCCARAGAGVEQRPHALFRAHSQVLYLEHTYHECFKLRMLLGSS
eukprot:2817572-Amphidinium_carterae.3